VSVERLFEELRFGAFAVAYRMLGSVSEAEDVVQEAFLRLHRAMSEGERIASPRAYVATVVTRLGIDQLRSARVRRERYVGEWLSEPLVTSPDAEPVQHADTADSLSVFATTVIIRAVDHRPRQRTRRAPGRARFIAPCRSPPHWPSPSRRTPAPPSPAGR
jgi:RNA polymerase sigma factor (sigma-70 family)